MKQLAQGHNQQPLSGLTLTGSLDTVLQDMTDYYHTTLKGYRCAGRKRAIYNKFVQIIHSIQQIYITLLRSGIDIHQPLGVHMMSVLMRRLIGSEYGDYLLVLKKFKVIIYRSSSYRVGYFSKTITLAWRYMPKFNKRRRTLLNGKFYKFNGGINTKKFIAINQLLLDDIKQQFPEINTIAETVKRTTLNITEAIHNMKSEGYSTKQIEDTLANKNTVNLINQHFNLSFRRGDFYKGYNGPLYYHMTGLNKHIRHAIRINGNRTVELDITAAHPKLLQQVIGTNNIHYAKITDLYQWCVRNFGGTREEWKDEFQRYLDKPRWDGTIFYHIFYHLFPDMFDAMFEYGSILQSYVAREVANIIRHRSRQLSIKYPHIHFHLVHDCWIVEEQYEATVRCYLSDLL
jgi:hypothetical protein